MSGFERTSPSRCSGGNGFEIARVRGAARRVVVLMHARFAFNAGRETIGAVCYTPPLVVISRFAVHFLRDTHSPSEPVYIAPNV